jgi:hypothetical protein
MQQEVCVCDQGESAHSMREEGPHLILRGWTLDSWVPLISLPLQIKNLVLDHTEMNCRFS